MKTHQTIQHEFVPDAQFYPSNVPLTLPQTPLEAAQSAVSKDLNVSSHIDAYDGYPEVQDDIFEFEVQQYLAKTSVKEVSTPKTAAMGRDTVYVTHTEPLVFYWDRMGTLPNKVQTIMTNPSLYIAPVLEHVTALRQQEFKKRVGGIAMLASLGNEDEAFAIHLAVTRQARNLGIESLELGLFNRQLSVDQKLVA